MSKENIGKSGPGWAEIDDIIPPTDETVAKVRPPELGQTNKEKECTVAGDEQEALHIAEGEEEARHADIIAAETEVPAATAIEQLGHTKEKHEERVVFRDTAKQKLGQYADRPHHGESTYRWRLGGLLVGDVAGISGAALLLGETYFNAIGQAVSAGVAAVTLGAIGSEVKRIVQARARAADADKLDESYAPFFRFFTPANRLDAIVKLVTVGAIIGIAVIAVAIFSLRESTEGGSAGLCFGLLALAIGIASFVNSYTTTACAVCDYLDDLDRDVAASAAELEARKADLYIKAHAGAVAEAKSIRQTAAARGKAAKLGRLRELFGILSKNPRIVGHGDAAPASVIAAVPSVRVEAPYDNSLNGKSQA